jgi:hypothetical protein
MIIAGVLGVRLGPEFTLSLSRGSRLNLVETLLPWDPQQFVLLRHETWWSIVCQSVIKTPLKCTNVATMSNNGQHGSKT